MTGDLNTTSINSLIFLNKKDNSNPSVGLSLNYAEADGIVMAAVSIPKLNNNSEIYIAEWSPIATVEQLMTEEVEKITIETNYIVDLMYSTEYIEYSSNTPEFDYIFESTEDDK
jgi:hypothetical protein